MFFVQQTVYNYCKKKVVSTPKSLKIDFLFDLAIPLLDTSEGSEIKITKKYMLFVALFRIAEL